MKFKRSLWKGEFKSLINLRDLIRFNKKYLKSLKNKKGIFTA